MNQAKKTVFLLALAQALAMTGSIVGSTLDVAGFQRAMVVVAALMFAGGIVSWLGIRTPAPVTDAPSSAVGEPA